MRHDYRFYAAAMISASLVVSAADAQVITQPAKPIIKPMPRPGQVATRPKADIFIAPRLLSKPGGSGAGLASARIRAENVKIRQRPRLAVMAVGQPAGIHRLNGMARGVLEPGGDYEIGGAGFGTAPGSVFMRHGGRTIAMRVTHWSDGQIFASVPGDVFGLPDAASVELAIGPVGKPVYRTTRFGFRAARADVPLKITNAMFSHDKGKIMQIGSLAVPTNIGPERTSFDGEKYEVSRYVFDDGGKKRCFEPGFDRIRFDVPLKPGFEVTAAYYTHIPSDRGRYAMSWEAGAIRMEYGVDREYTPRYVLLPGHGSCGSRYTVKIIVTGPRGLPAQ